MDNSNKQNKEQPNTVYINSSNGYLDKQITKLFFELNNLKKEIKEIKTLLNNNNNNENDS